MIGRLSLGLSWLLGCSRFWDFQDIDFRIRLFVDSIAFVIRHLAFFTDIRSRNFQMFKLVLKIGLVAFRMSLSLWILLRDFRCPLPI